MIIAIGILLYLAIGLIFAGHYVPEILAEARAQGDLSISETPGIGYTFYTLGWLPIAIAVLVMNLVEETKNHDWD